MTLEYRGFVLVQDDDNNINIYKNDILLVHEVNKERCSLKDMHDEIDKFLEEYTTNKSEQKVLIKSKKVSL